LKRAPRSPARSRPVTAIERIPVTYVQRHCRPRT
jgi:hypothetical protein